MLTLNKHTLEQTLHGLLAKFGHTAFLSGGPIVLCRWGGNAAACCRYWCSYSPLQAWQSCELWCMMCPSYPIGVSGKTSTYFFLKQGWEQWIWDLQEIVPGMETTAEEKLPQPDREVTELKAAISHWALDTHTWYHLLGRQVLTYVTWGFWLLQLSPCCLEEPVWKFRAPGWVSRCSGKRVKLRVSHVRNRNPTFSRPPWFFVSLGR